LGASSVPIGTRNRPRGTTTFNTGLTGAPSPHPSPPAGRGGRSLRWTGSRTPTACPSRQAVPGGGDFPRRLLRRRSECRRREWRPPWMSPRRVPPAATPADRRPDADQGHRAPIAYTDINAARHSRHDGRRGPAPRPTDPAFVSAGMGGSNIRPHPAPQGRSDGASTGSPYVPTHGEFFLGAARSLTHIKEIRAALDYIEIVQKRISMSLRHNWQRVSPPGAIFPALGAGGWRPHPTGMATAWLSGASNDPPPVQTVRRVFLFSARRLPARDGYAGRVRPGRRS
jgi:hypothetical protein